MVLKSGLSRPVSGIFRNLKYHDPIPPAVIMFTDIVGYTALMDEVEPKAFKKEKG